MEDNGRAGSPDALCMAPFTSLHLDPRGEVRACCQNTWLRLGNVAEMSLLEIWRGPILNRLRDELRRGSFDLGCELCAECYSRGTPDAAYLHGFEGSSAVDEWAAWPSQLELALSNSCNLQCVHCNGELSSSIRIHREGRRSLGTVYDDSFFDQLDEILPHLDRILFLGGEPLLASESLRVMERLLELRLRPMCHISTNGTQWNQRVASILSGLPVHVSVSVDGRSKEVVESIRMGVDHASLCRNITRISEAVRSSGSTYSLSFCLMRPNWHEFRMVLEWADELDVDVIVNSVQHPAALSLLHSSNDELARVVDALEKEDPCNLGRNLRVWNEQLASLRSILASRLSGPPVTPVGLSRSASAGASGRVVLTVDESQIVRSVTSEGDDLLGAALEPVVGDALGSVVVVMCTALGELESSTLERRADGTEKRHFVFRDATQRVTVRSVLVPGQSGSQRWILNSRVETLGSC